jgi:hypothetical protein
LTVNPFGIFINILHSALACVYARTSMICGILQWLISAQGKIKQIVGHAATGAFFPQKLTP